MAIHPSIRSRLRTTNYYASGRRLLLRENIYSCISPTRALNCHDTYFSHSPRDKKTLSSAGSAFGHETWRSRKTLGLLPLVCQLLVVFHLPRFESFSTHDVSIDSKGCGVYVGRHTNGKRRLPSWSLLCVRRLFFSCLIL